MNRPRKKDKHLPPCVYYKHGAYYYVKRNDWKRLGNDLGTAMREWARRVAQERKAGALLSRHLSDHEDIFSLALALVAPLLVIRHWPTR